MQSGCEAGNMCLSFSAPTHAVVAMCFEAGCLQQQILYPGTAVRLRFTVWCNEHLRITLQVVALSMSMMHHDTVPMSQMPQTALYQCQICDMWLVLDLRPVTCVVQVDCCNEQRVCTSKNMLVCQKTNQCALVMQYMMLCTGFCVVVGVRTWKVKLQFLSIMSAYTSVTSDNSTVAHWYKFRNLISGSTYWEKAYTSARAPNHVRHEQEKRRVLVLPVGMCHHKKL